MNRVAKALVVGIVVFAALQLVRPGIPAKPATAELQAPPEIKRILEKSCYSCHSDERRLAWFDEIVPGYWLVRHDILTAREHLDFSTIGSKPAAAQKGALYEAVNMIQLGAMPLPQFLALHPDAKVTPEELATLKTYLAPWSNRPTVASNAAGAASAAAGGAVAAEGRSTAAQSRLTQSPAALDAVEAEFGGFAFDPAFENWKPISTTDRGDNYTFRFILGNDIAVQAAQAGHISPWPDGARLAKIAWQQELGADGLVHPGKFVQVELMVKDAQRYKNTDGWGWGRWRGLDLKPYGSDSRFVNECTTCHLPVRGNDYVYTLPITPAKVDHAEVVNNHAAALPASLPYQPLAWSAITMYVDPKTRTTATLYGNDAAMQAVRAREDAVAAPAYSVGAVLALVTWAQRDDPHWFGGRIPDAPLSVELIQLTTEEPTATYVPRVTYKRFAGAELTEDHVADSVMAERSKFITGLAPARLP
jgi:Haem-binding domain/Cytochrome P460